MGANPCNASACLGARLRNAARAVASAKDSNPAREILTDATNFARTGGRGASDEIAKTSASHRRRS